MTNSGFGSQFSASKKINQRDKLIFLAVAGLVISLALLIFVFTSKKSDPEIAGNEIVPVVASNVGTVTLFATDRPIKQGTKLSDYNFKPVNWPRNSVPEAAVRDVAEMVEMFAKTDVPANQPIQRTHLTKQVAMPALPITPGLRAVTIAVDDRSGIEGWAQPGTRVDVILTYQQEADLKSKIIIENARVLSLGGDARDVAERMAGSRRAESQRTITLEVSPQDALKVQTSLQIGRLSLMMRAPEDDRSPAVTELTVNQIDSSFGSRGGTAQSCNRGTMRVGDKEYLIDCDGSLAQIANPDEP